MIEIQDGQETDDPAPKSGGRVKDGCMIDTYNQQIQYDVSCTIRTNINTANHHFIVEECNSKENISTPTKVSTGTQHKSSFEDNLGGGISRTVKTDDSLATMEEPKAVSYTRDSKGKTQNKHLNEIVNTIHSSTGSGGNTDCFVAEPQVQQIGNIYPDTDNFKNRTSGRV